MTKQYDGAIITQFLFFILFIIHRSFRAIGSDFMFGVLMVSILSSIYLLWQIYIVKNVFGLKKTLGIICASLPIIWLLLLVGFLS